MLRAARVANTHQPVSGGERFARQVLWPVQPVVIRIASSHALGRLRGRIKDDWRLALLFAGLRLRLEHRLQLLPLSRDLSGQASGSDARVRLLTSHVELVDRSRDLRRDVAVAQVVEDELARPLRGIAE